MITSRTVHLTTSSAVVAACLALTGAMSAAASDHGARLGTDHLAQSIGQSVGQSVGLDASTVGLVSGPGFDIGAVAELRHQQFAQYVVDHALELIQNR